MKTKIFFGIFVIALLLFAFPAFAEENAKSSKERPAYGRAANIARPAAVARAEKNIEVKTARLDAVQDRKEAVEAMQKEREVLKERKEELRDQIKEAPKEERKELRENAKEEIKAEATKIREERKDKFEDAKAKVEAVAKAAKERLEAAKVEQKTAKDEINAVKDKVKECKGSETEECSKVRKDVKQKTRTFLSSAIERVLGLLQKTRENLTKSKLSEDAKKAHLAEVDAKIQEVASLKDKEAQLSADVSAEDIKQINSQLSNAWKETQNTIRKSAGTIAAEKLGGVVQTSEKLQQRLTKTLSKLKEKGTDVSRAEAKISDFNKLISEAKALQEEAKRLFLSKEPGKTDEVMREATQKVKQAHEKINQAHKILKEILSLLKAEKGGEKALEEATEEKGTPAVKSTPIETATATPAATASEV